MDITYSDIKNHLIKNEIDTLHKILNSDTTDSRSVLLEICSVLDSLYPESIFTRNGDILAILDLPFLLGIEQDLTAFLNKHMMDAEELVYDDIKSALFQMAENQITQRGSVLFFELSGFPRSMSGVAKDAENLRKNRLIEATHEIQDLVDAAEKDQDIDLMKLWLTHYGFWLLFGMGLGRHAQREEAEIALERLKVEIEKWYIELGNNSKSFSNSEYDNDFRDTIEGISRVAGGYKLSTQKPPQYQPPRANQLLDAIAISQMAGGNQNRLLPLQILSATWLFPPGNETNELIQLRILGKLDDPADSDQMRLIARFLQTLDCSDEESSPTTRNVLEVVTNALRQYHNEGTYRVLLRHLSCLGKNENSLIGRFAADYICNYYLDSFSEDIPFHDYVSWMGP
ncbi:MAG: hypothetical protein GF309_08900, partial [Candidatus Lokiarchaeota archaeon]|nr:hypothetical protein [Candidatus Lokiarchaeota archaeon]